ncbi:Vacuolar protease A [Irineochytrium annulatum]|nr:Vacuolar protease A [Irineochytrium annulatum]
MNLPQLLLLASLAATSIIAAPLASPQPSPSLSQRSLPPSESPLFRIAIQKKPAAQGANRYARDRVFKSTTSRIRQFSANGDGGAKGYVGPGAKGNGSDKSSAPLLNLHDNSYNCPVTLGNGQKFMLDLDTGSSDTWFRGPNCQATDDSCEGAKVDLSDPNLSRTGLSWTTHYGMGMVAGDIYIGNVSIGDAVADRLLIGVSDKEDQDGDTDGILGLAYSSISQIKLRAKESEYNKAETNFLNALNLPKGADMFGFYLSDYEDGDAGEVVFGGYDADRMTGNITWLDINSESYWQFDISDMRYRVGEDDTDVTVGDYGGEEVKGSSIATDKCRSAIADTGTTLVILDDVVAAEINAKLGAKQIELDFGAFYEIDCSVANDPDAPTLYISMGRGKGELVLPPSAYVLASDDSGECLSGISGGADGGVGIFGDIILRQYYSIYDRGSRRLGLAKAVHTKDDSAYRAAAAGQGQQPVGRQKKRVGVFGDGRMVARPQTGRKLKNAFAKEPKAKKAETGFDDMRARWGLAPK